MIRQQEAPFFGTNGETGKKAGDFIRLLANKVSEKNGEPYAIIS